MAHIVHSFRKWLTLAGKYNIIHPVQRALPVETGK